MLGPKETFGSRSFARFVALGLFASTTATPVPSANASESDVCLTLGCIQAAAHILNNLHPERESIDPCEDFDQCKFSARQTSYIRLYSCTTVDVCGGFPVQYPNEEIYATLDSINSANQYILEEIMTRPYPTTGNQSDPDDKAIFDMLVKNYNSCMDNSTTGDAVPKEAQEMIATLAELFPVKDYSSNDTIKQADHESLTDAIVYLTKNGVPLFGEFSTSPDFQNPVSLLDVSMWYAVAQRFLGCYGTLIRIQQG